MQLNPNLVLASAGGAGLVFDPSERRSFWVNPTAARILKLLPVGGSLTSLSLGTLIRKIFPDQPVARVNEDSARFIRDLEGHGLVVARTSTPGTVSYEAPELSGTSTAVYSPPTIISEARPKIHNHARIRAARSSAARSAARSRASRAGFRTRR